MNQAQKSLESQMTEVSNASQIEISPIVQGKDGSEAKYSNIAEDLNVFLLQTLESLDKIN